MLHKTRGIVLNYIKYKESSIIVKVYTELFGIQSYVVNGVRSSRAKSNRIALFQPLTLLDMVVYHKSDREALHRLSEVRNLHPFSQLPFDMIKTSLAIFITELLGKCLKEEESNPALFEFLQQAVTELDDVSQGLESFHLVFMCRLASYLGFGIESNGQFQSVLSEYRYSDLADQKLKEAFALLLHDEIEELRRAGSQLRGRLLAQMLFYYRTHLEGFGDMKSLEILKTVLR